jgi:anti-anti-sigma factor
VGTEQTRIEVGEPDSDGGVPVLLTGELDQSRADQLREALETALGPRSTIVRIEARRLRLLDSTSLGLLLFFARKLQDRGGHLELRYATSSVRRTLEVAALGRSMRLVEEPGVQDNAGHT